MEKTKKALTATLILVLAVTMLLAGCSTKSTKTEVTATDTPKGAVSTEAPKTAVSSDAPKLDPVTLTLYYPGSPQKDEELVVAEINKYLKDKINASVDIKPIDWGGWDNRVNLMIASGEPADLIFTASWNGFPQNVGKGAFLDMTDLIDKYAPDAKKLINPAFLVGSKINGKNYGFPTNKELAATQGVLLRKDIADKYNMDLTKVKTAADLEPLLAIIKDKEPGMTPFYTNNDVGLIQALNWDSLGDNTVPGVLHKIGTDTKILNEVATPEFMNTAKLMRKWFLAGYINKDGATTRVKAQDLAKSGKVFMYTSALKPGAAAEVSVNVGHPMVSIDLTEPTITTGDTTGSMLAISKNSKNPERAMMLINLLHSDKTLNNLINFGIENKHYVKVSDGIIDFPPGVDGKTATYNPGAAWQLGNQFLNYIWKTEDPKKWDNFKEFNAKGKPSIALGFTFNGDSVKNEVAAYINVDNEFRGAISSGAVDPEQYIPKFLDKMKAAGVDKIIAEKQKQLDAWLASKK